jgi:hypothetical protein
VRRLFCLLVPVCCLLGCRGIGKPDNKYDLITAELRTRERELREAEAELNQLRLMNQAYQRQLQAQPACGPSFHQDGGVPTLPLRDIALGPGTGGVDADQQPGDESLMVVVIPRDGDGAAVKVPAKVTVSAFEVSREGMKTPIGRWEVPPDQLRRTWKSGLLSAGYFVPLQWDKPPATERVRLVARFTTLDGREYEADRDVTVRPLFGAPPRPPTVLPPPSVPELPRGVEELPPPAATLQPARPLTGR